MICAKKPPEKIPNIKELRKIFFSLCKAYSLRKMVSLDQKLKIPKTCEKQFNNNIIVDLWKKGIEKTPNIGQVGQFLKIGHLAKTLAHAKAIVLMQNGQLKVKIKKCQKHEKNPSTVTLQLFCAKNRSKKHQILEKWDRVLKIGHLEKGLRLCKAYSLCEMVRLGQKLKMPKTCEKPFHNNLRVGLCKKTLEKTPNIGEIRQS